MRNLLARIAGRAVERPTPVIFVAVLLTLIGAVAALRLQADRDPDSLVDRGSDTYAATQRFYEDFGDEPVEVLVKGDLRQLLRTENLARLLALESCLSGKAPGGEVASGQPAPPACAAISRLDPSAVVFGPATFLNQFAIQATELFTQQQQAGAGAGAAGGARGGAPGEEGRALRVPSSSGRRLAAFQQVLFKFGQQAQSPRWRVRPDGPAAAHQPALRLLGDLRSEFLRLRAEGPVLGDRPQLRRGPDLGSPAARSRRVRAPRGDLPVPRRGGRPELPPPEGVVRHPAELRGQRRAGCLRGAGGGALHPDLRPPGRRPGGDGDHPRGRSSGLRSGSCRSGSRSAQPASCSASCRWSGAR